MCTFFSFLTRKDGKMIYADWKTRKTDLTKEWDSHSFLAEHFKNDSGISHNEDLLNKWEYNPLNQTLVSDSMVFDESKSEVLARCKSLDFKTICEPLIIKPIFDPFSVTRKDITKEELNLLLQWDSVKNSLRNSIWDAIGDSIGYSIWNSTWNSIGDSIRESIGDSTRGYLSSFFNVKYESDFSSINKLWNAGIVPSFDGTLWRLHNNKSILWQGTVEELKNLL